MTGFNRSGPKSLPGKLEKYFATQAHVLGHRSAFRDGFTSGGSEDDGAPARAVDAHRSEIRGHRRLEMALAELDQEQRNVLWLAFGPEKWPTQIAKAFGKYCGVALVTSVARGVDETNPGRWLRSTVARNHKASIRAVQNECNRLVQFSLWSLAEHIKLVRQVEDGIASKITAAVSRPNPRGLTPVVWLNRDELLEMYPKPRG